MTALQKAQQAPENFRCRYLYQTTGQKLEEAKEEGKPIGRSAISTNLDPSDCYDIDPPIRQHIQLI
jgi:hypothetical protein